MFKLIKWPKEWLELRKLLEKVVIIQKNVGQKRKIKKKVGLKALVIEKVTEEPLNLQKIVGRT